MMRLLRTRKGFTLIEMLMVLLVVGIVMPSLILSLRSATQLVGPSADAATTIARYSVADGFFARNLPVAERPLRQAYDEQMEFVATVNGKRQHVVVWRDCSTRSISFARLDPIRTNLIINPSFESGTAAGWTYYSTAPDADWPASPLTVVNAATSQSVASGTQALQITRATSPDNTASALSTPIPVTTGDRFILSGSYRTTRVQDIDQSTTGTSIQYRWLNAAGDYLPTLGGGWTERVHSNDGWVRRSTRTEAAPAGAAAIRVALVSGELTLGTSYFDGISLVKDVGTSDYFDGDTAGSIWNGPATSSTSTYGTHGHATTWPPPATPPSTGTIPSDAEIQVLARVPDTVECTPGNPGYEPLFTYYRTNTGTGAREEITDPQERLTDTTQMEVYLPPVLADSQSTFTGAVNQIYALGASNFTRDAFPVADGDFEQATSLWRLDNGSVIPTTGAVAIADVTDVHGDEFSATHVARLTAPVGSSQGIVSSSVNTPNQYAGAKVQVWAKRTGAITAIPTCQIQVSGFNGATWSAYSTTTISPDWGWKGYTVNVPSTANTQARIRLTVSSVTGTGTGGCLFDRVASLQGDS